MRILPRNAWLALPVGWLAFFGLATLTKYVAGALSGGPPWASQAFLKIALLAFALAAATVEGLNLRQLGFCRPEHAIWGKAIGGGLALGIVTTLVVMIAGVRGLRSVVGGYSFGALVLWVWIVSSVSEEIFCRGWFQTSTAFTSLLPSALLFGSMHLLLLTADVDAGSVTIVVVATTALGLVTAWARAASASLYPPIAAHVAFNAGGVVGGILYAIAYGITTGKPFQP